MPILLFFFMTFALAVKPIVAQDLEVPEKSGWHWDFALDGNVFAAPFDANNIPLSIRQIPIHPDDANVGRINYGQPISPVPNGLLKAKSLLGFGGSIGRGYRAGTNKYSFRVTYGYLTESGQSHFPQQEYNYIDGGSNAGYGAALTYYDLRLHKTWIPGSDVTYERGNQYRFVTGYRVTPYKVEIESGWDRYNQLEVYKNYPIAINLLHEVYAGFKYLVCDEDHFCDGWQVTAGPVFNSAMTEGLGKSLDFSPNRSWAVSFKLVGSW